MKLRILDMQYYASGSNTLEVLVAPVDGTDHRAPCFGDPLTTRRAIYDGIRATIEIGIGDLLKVIPKRALKIENEAPEIKKVIFNNPATIVLWEDGTKTVVKAQNGETFDEEKGLALAISKKVLGNKGNFNNIFKRYIGGKNESIE